MALDIDQLDAIIDKFMDYARPGEVKLMPVHLAQRRRPRDARRSATRARSASARAWRSTPRCMADEIELGRVSPEPVRERAPLRPLDRHRHRARAS